MFFNVNSNVIRIISIPMLVLAVFLSGCSVKEVGKTVTYSIKGEHYLQVDDPKKGEAQFRREVEADPLNPLTNYYYGRMLLRQEKVSKALPYLQKASELDPYDADYHFWTGVAHGSLKQTRNERDRYERTLVLEPDHVEALTYLGHYYLKKKNYTKAINNYERALQVWPESPSALYNRALALSQLKRTPEEKVAWHMYLEGEPSGNLAKRAIKHLNELNDFSYRNYRIGTRTVGVARMDFEPFSATLTAAAKDSLKIIGDAAVDARKGKLQVLVYQKNNIDLARERAKSIRAYLYRQYPELQHNRLGISWFDTPQRLKGKKYAIEESVDFFISTK